MAVNKFSVYVILFLSFLSLILSASNTNTTSTEENKNTHELPLVVEINENNFEEFNSTHTYYYLEFYTPWCIHCQKMAPLYETAAKMAKENNIPCTFAKVDATANEELVEKFNVEGYPTLLWINNKDGIVSGYNGEREAKDFYSFVLRKLNLFKIEEIHSFEEIQKYNTTTSGQNILLVLINDMNVTIFEREIKILMDAAADQNKYDKVFATNAKSILEQFNLQKENFAILSFLYDKEIKVLRDAEKVEFDFHEDLTTAQTASKLLSFYKHKVYGEINEDEMNNLIERGEPTMILFYGPETKPERLTLVHKFMKEIATKYRKILHVFHSSIKSKATNVIVEVLRFKKENMPMLLITHLKQKANENEMEELEKFKLEKVNMTQETVEKFIDDWKNKKAVPFLASEDIPANPYENGILKVVGHNFDEFITTQGKDLILAICSSVVRRCIPFYKRLARVAQKLKNNTNLIIAQTDPNFNEFHINIAPKFPVIFFFPTDDYNLKPIDRFENRVLFDGEFTTRNITHFIVQNAQHTIVVNNIENEDLIHRQETKEVIEVRVEGDEDSDYDFDEYVKKQYGSQTPEKPEEMDLSALLESFKTSENAKRSGNDTNTFRDFVPEESLEKDDDDEEEEDGDEADYGNDFDENALNGIFDDGDIAEVESLDKTSEEKEKKKDDL